MSFLSIILKFSKIFKAKKPPTCSAVIAAAGTSDRCRGEDKLFYFIDGKPVIAHTIDIFQKCDLINEIIIISQEDKYEEINKICSQYGFTKVSKIMKGGTTRQDSVINGVYATSHTATLIAIHDGARPCIQMDILKKSIIAASKYHAAAPVISINSTVKNVENGIIVNTVDRDGLYEIQTPQVFRAEIIKAALTNAKRKSITITDDCMAVEAINVPVHTVEGSHKNIKITNIDDLCIARAFLSNNGDR